jgi:UDPglucose 6-dehydrogenase
VKLGVIGIGVVGGAVMHGFERLGHIVRGYDIKYETAKLSDLRDAEAVFVCVPTPAAADGSCDASRVEGVVDQLAEMSYSGLAVIKSTVPPGTTDRLQAMYTSMRLAFCPEFLRERAAVVDFYENHDVCVLGVYLDRPDDEHVLREAHGDLPDHVAVMTPTEAELSKYYSNVFNALRVVFANEFFEVCKTMGADYGVIKNAMVKRTTIADAYLDCNERFRGFGGVCLPKDTAAFAAHVRSLGLNSMKLFETIVDENKKFQVTIPAGMRQS